jgi:hypothetical protein
VHKIWQARFGTNAETEDSIIDGGAVPRGTPDMEIVLTEEEKSIGPFGQALARPFAAITAVSEIARLRV